MKQVTFFPEDSIIEVENRDEFPVEERQSIWYDASEISAIEEECRITIARMRSDPTYLSADTMDEGVCIRGLESPRNLPLNLRRAHMAVFHQQDYQISQEGRIYDDEEIAEVYIAFTGSSQRAAIVRALRDQQDVHGRSDHFPYDDHYDSLEPAEPMVDESSNTISGGDQRAKRRRMRKLYTPEALRRENVQRNAVASKAA
eukprot:CAMPEP_0176090528 /NCGR_PEP_ID=MMETSP0120_2-20121206/45339_1 /TAXON_ID=160619 /ORGANISM="Kryptoperidinium foliaceum, Strain CCMP 1326" /LENGTH=200 /DNA_ID=CAMNT_0017424411 /DNA_START=71 /DNA_END=673 /DNA_ORIENTATION=-